jgi:hypothetical protein
MGCHSSRISYYKLRIICIKLSDNPYPSDIANTKSASASAHNRIQIIHIRMDIKNSSPNSHNSDSDRIGCGNYPHHFHPYSLDRSPLGVNKYLMERQFHAPCMDAIVFSMVWSGQRGKFVKEEAVIKCDGEGDDDAMRRLGKPLIEHKWSCQAWRVDQCCMNTFKSCMKDHGSATTRRYVRKTSSMTLNEALCGRQPSFYLFIYTW